MPAMLLSDADVGLGGGTSAPQSNGGLLSDADVGIATSAAPARYKSSAYSIARQVPAGFNEGLATVAGAPVDVMAWLLNRIPGVDIKQPFAGSKSIKSAMGLIGANPDALPARTAGERIARGAGEGVATMIVPATAAGGLVRAGMEVAPAIIDAVGMPTSAGEAAATTAIGATSGAGGKAAAEAVPDQYKPIAELVGGVGGGIAGIGGVAAARGVGKTIGAVGDYVEPLTAKGQANRAGRELVSSANSPSAALDELDNAPRNLVPGSNPTTFQVTGDMGLGSLERDVATPNPGDFTQRRAEQNMARNAALARMQETGSPADVSMFLRSELRSIDSDTEQAIARATMQAQNKAAAIGGTLTPETYGEAIRAAAEPGRVAASDTARSAVDQIGGTGSPEAYGATMRTTLANARSAAKIQERQLWNAVDPDGTLSLPVDPIRQEGSAIEQGMTKSARPIEGEEQAILDVIKNYGDAVPFREVTDLRSRVSTAMREELRTAGETATYARLRRLRGAVEDAIGSAVEQRAEAESQAVAAGQIAPEQTMAAMLSRFAAEKDAWLARRAQDTRTGDGGADGSATAGASAAVPSAPRADGQIGGRLLGDAGGAGLPEAPLQPNFDATAQERLRAATAATRARKETYDSGAVGSILRSAGMQGQYRLQDAAVPSAVFKPGPGGFEAIQAFRRAAGDDAAALGVVHDYAAASMRRAAETPDGSIDAVRYAAWRRAHQDALRAVPGLQERFDAAARASEPLVAFRPVNPEISAAHVPEAFFHPGTGGFEDVQQLRDLIGDKPALFILGDYAASRLRQAAMKPDGTLDPGRLATWQRQHADALRAFPDLQAKFIDAAHATEAIGEAAANRKAALDAYQQGAFGRLIGVHDAQDITRVVGGLFGQKNSVEEFRRLATATNGDQAARAGLRKAIVDYIANRFVANTEAATSGAGIIKSDGFQTFVRQNATPLRQVFSPEEVASLQAIAGDLRRANRSVTAVRLPGGSNTAQDQATQQVSLLRTVMRHSVDASLGAGAGAHFGGPIGAIVGAIGGMAFSSMREAGLRKVDDLIKAAMLDPTLAGILLRKAAARADAGPAVQLSKYLRRVVASTLFQQPGSDGMVPIGTGARDHPVRIDAPAGISHASDLTQVPSPAQAKAGNYQKRHVIWNGLNISVETEAGQDRTGIGRDGKPWAATAVHPYGYFRGSEGKDGEHIDVYMGPNPQVQHAFVFDQIDPKTGKFDEHKVIIGAADLNEARSVYDSGFSDASGPDRRGAVREMSVPELKTWLASGDTKKPIAYEPKNRTEGRARIPQPKFSIIKPMSLQEMFADKRSADQLRKALGMTKQ